MLTRDMMHLYQGEAVNHANANYQSMLWLGMGLGKTIITLSSIVDRMNAGQVKKVLIFGPVRVINSVWAQEAQKWEHTKHLRFSTIHGTPMRRSRAMFADADVHMVNYENANWFCEQLLHYYIDQGKPLPYDMVVYDEISKFKNSTSKRMAGGYTDRTGTDGKEIRIKLHGWRKMIPHFKYRMGLTGTPAANGYLDLFGQFLAIDGGDRLGEFVTHFKDSYFKSDYMGWGCEVTTIGKQFIEQKISDITLKMDAKDYLDLPAVKVTNMMVDLPAKARKAYNEMEAQMFAALDNGDDLEVFSKAAVSNKCCQIANGAAYLSAESDEWTKVHDAKLDALEEVLEEAGGSPVLCSYSFKADAQRIMTKFKKYKPVNLTAEKASATAGILKRWREGKIKLLVGHPACLHPRTQVLTQHRGWVNLIDVKSTDLVHDGVEFVSHSGCSYSGYKEVVNRFGITMTPDHRLLIQGRWEQAQNVRDCGDTKRKALYQYEGNDKYLSEMFTLRNCVKDTSSECDETQSVGEETLPALHGGAIPLQNAHADLVHLARIEESLEGSRQQGLRGSWDRNVQRVGRLQSILRGYARNLSGQFNHRESGCEQRIFKGELYVGDDVQAAIQQTQQPIRNLSGGDNAPRGTVSEVRMQQDDVTDETEQRNERGSSSRFCEEFNLRKEKVYDLVDCGPRHRFLVRNDEGEVFISHNSMGHGIDGLQDTGHIMVWFGMNWSLELYEQMNARIDRQGQTHPVSIIRILANDTVDLAVADAIERKTDNQTGLKDALQRYRKGITTNALEVNFF
jgi:hypothetical protein